MNTVAAFLCEAANQRYDYRYRSSREPGSAVSLQKYRSNRVRRLPFDRKFSFPGDAVVGTHYTFRTFLCDNFIIHIIGTLRLLPIYICVLNYREFYWYIDLCINNHIIGNIWFSFLPSSQKSSFHVKFVNSRCSLNYIYIYIIHVMYSNYILN